MLSTDLPHRDVLVRLAPSPIHGIGAFALAPIAAGTVCFAQDRAEIRWVDAASLDSELLTVQQRAFYDDFAIRRDGRLGCPASFDLLTPGWYLNRPRPGEPANVHADVDFNLVALRDIAAGEELTLDYDELNRAAAISG